MNSKYLAGIDIGTTGAKAAIFNLHGEMISSNYKEYSCTYPKPNWIEQDPKILVLSAMDVAKKAIYKSKINPAEIASLGISTQRSCTIFLDRLGNLLRPMISWQDSRSAVEVEEIASKISPVNYYKITGFPNNTTWLLSKILWIRKNEPQTWEKTTKIIQLQDYTLRAFGASDYFDDISDAGFSGIWDTNRFTWSKELLNLFDIDSNMLPIPTLSGKKIGVISKKASEKSGFKCGTPLCVGAGDQNSAAVGAGIVYNGYLSVSMGTAGNANAYLEKPFRDPEGKSMVVNHAIYNRWQIEGHQAGAAGVYRWFRDKIGMYEKYYAEKNNKDVYEILNKLISKTPAGSKGLVFLPYLASSTAPRWNPNARGVLAGLAFVHSRGCVARSFMEGITLEMKDIINSITNSGIKIKISRITGGATKSDVWNQIQSDVYNLKVETLQITDTAVMGAAIMGGVGVGIFKDIIEGVENMVKVDKIYEPLSKNAEIYDELYDIYCRLYECLDRSKVFNKLVKLQEKL